MTEEQTNNSFFNGKEVRKKAMLKAQQTQMHKRAKTTKNRLGKTMNDKCNEGDNESDINADKSDTEDKSEMVKNIIYQTTNYETNEREKHTHTQRINKFNMLEDRENMKIDKA
eukprot:1136918-Heterocapsa_arctica.AAC.1